MKLIQQKGLNCYTGSIISIINVFHAEYMPVFGNLWSETDFQYKQADKFYSSKRLLENAGHLGFSFDLLPTGTMQETEYSMSSLEEGAFLAAGMNAFHVPWSPHFGIFSGTHYFIIKYSKTDQMLCYDPTYGLNDIPLSRKIVLEHIGEATLVQQYSSQNLQFDDRAEFQAVLQKNPQTLKKLLIWFTDCLLGHHKEADTAARYVDCMTNNRCLYQQYLTDKSPKLTEGNPIWNSQYFHDWTALKNGLYKAALLPKNQDVLKEADRIAASLLERESAAAELLCG